MGRENKNSSYVLITPARNEELSIERTIQSVIAQTVLPKKWVIVSDGSTDKTDEIIKKYLQKNLWIEFIRMPEHRDRHFAAKVQCFEAGYERMKGVDFGIIGNLDADISFDEGYFEFLLSKFAEDPKLGVAGTPFVEDGKHYDYSFTNIEHVSGACQLFRRECFEEIGGYIPIKGGGIDWVAVTTARMKGWKTRTFHRKNLPPSPENGYRQHQCHDDLVQAGGERLFLWQSSPLGNFQDLLSNDKKPFSYWWIIFIVRVVSAGMKRMKDPFQRTPEFIRREQMRD